MTKASDNVFPRFLVSEGGSTATPAANRVTLYAKTDGLLYSKDDAGVETLVSGGGGGAAVATDTIWDAAGDLVQGTGANTAARLASGTAGFFLMANGVGTAVSWATREINYVEFTSNVNITATTETTADVVVTGGTVTYDGATTVIVDFYSYGARPATDLADRNLQFYLFDGTPSGTASIGRIGTINSPTAASVLQPIFISRRLTPSGTAHSYSIRCSVNAGTGVVAAEAGGTANAMPGFIRITRAK